MQQVMNSVPFPDIWKYSEGEQQYFEFTGMFNDFLT